MRVLHVSLASIYTDGLTYQDNLLVEQNLRDGHEVCVVADCSMYMNGRVVRVQPCDEKRGGMRLVRLPYVSFGFNALTQRLRYAPDLRRILEEFQPDVILYHGVVGVGLWTVARYKLRRPRVRIYLDSHEDFHNSGRYWISRLLQYRVLTRFLLSRVRPHVEKILYVSYEAAEFLRAMYGLRPDEMEFFPLGGVIREEGVRRSWRSEVRGAYGIDDSKVVFFHSGKLDRGKKTAELLAAFRACDNPDFLLLVAGSLAPETQSELLELFQRDRRVRYVGWVSGGQLQRLLCASDMYIQPGTQSATLQLALCCGLPVAVFPYPSHEPYVVGNGYYIRREEDMLRVFEEITRRRELLADMSRSSMEIARRTLDYAVLAARLYRN